MLTLVCKSKIKVYFSNDYNEFHRNALIIYLYFFLELCYITKPLIQ